GYGHEAGDLVLKEVSHRILSCLRVTDTAARVGGDEFVVVMPGLRDRSEAERLAEIIMDSIRQPIPFRSQALVAGASVGISVFPEDGAQLETLMAIADHGMYREKSRHLPILTRA